MSGAPLPVDPGQRAVESRPRRGNRRATRAVTMTPSSARPWSGWPPTRSSSSPGTSRPARGRRA